MLSHHSVLRQIQGWVIFTCQFSLFKVFFRGVYSLIFKLVNKILWLDSRIEAVFLRTTQPPSPWEPGLSDFDLTIVIKEFDNQADRLKFINDFWKKYKLIRLIAPMLVEVDLLTVLEFENFLKLSSPFYQDVKKFDFIFCKSGAREKLTLALDQSSKNSPRENKPPEWALFRHFFIVYLYFLLPKLSHFPSRNRILQVRWKHLVRKINRLLTKIESTLPHTYIQSHPPTDDESDFDAISDLARIGLRSGIIAQKLIRKPTSPNSGVPIPEVTTFEGSLQQLHLLLVNLFPKKSEDPEEFISIVSWKPFTASEKIAMAILVPDHVERSVLTKILEKLRVLSGEERSWLNQIFMTDFNLFGAPPVFPLIINFSIWSALGYLYPQEGLAIQSSAQMVLGKAFFPEIPKAQSAIASEAIIHYGIGLINRNDWIKETHERQNELFKTLLIRTQIYLELLNPDKLCPNQLSRTDRPFRPLTPLKQLYAESSILLEQLWISVNDSRQSRP